MRKLTTSFCILAFGLCMSTYLFAQTPALARYPLTADTLAVVTGNITAVGQTCTDTVCVKDFTGSPGVGDAMRLWRGGLLWPKETAVNYSRYAEYKVQPKPGNSLTVDSVAVEIGCYGTNSYLFANISCSANDPTFSSAVQLDTSTAPLPDIRTLQMASRSYPVNKFIGGGQTFYLRVFPWYGTTGGTTKWIVIRNVRIYGRTSPASGIERATEGIPTEFALLQNYPNPFNPSTTLEYSISKSSHVLLEVFDVLGQSVARLVDGELTAGTYKTIFDASKLSSGVYLYRLKAGDFIQTQKMVLMK